MLDFLFDYEGTWNLHFILSYYKKSGVPHKWAKALKNTVVELIR